MVRSFIIFIVLTITISYPYFLEAETKKRIKVGVSAALTGNLATMGSDIKNSISLANQHLGNDKYELIFEDDKCDPKTSVAVATKFVNVHKVAAVIGIGCSSAVLAAAKIYEDAKILTIVTASSSPRISNLGHYIFRTTPSDSLSSNMLYEHIKKSSKSLGIISNLDNYTQDFKDLVLEADKNNKIVKIQEDFLPNSFDFKPTLLRFKNMNLDSLLINVLDENSFAIILRQLKEINWKPRLFGAYLPSSPTLKVLAKDLLEGVEFVNTPSLKDILQPSSNSIYKDFQKKYGNLKSLESVFVSSYEGFRVLDLALGAKAKNKKVDLKSFVSSTKYNGLFGFYSFDKYGDIVGIPFVLKKIQKGKVIDIESSAKKIKIGLVSDFSGPGSYWGNQTRVGAQLAVQDLKREGVELEVEFGDSSFKAIKGRSEVERMINLHNVDALFVEFSPIVTATSSIAYSNNLLFLNNSAATSILKTNPYAFKAFLDYEKGCQEIAENWKQKGVKKIGLLRWVSEASELCIKGGKKVFSVSDIHIEDIEIDSQPTTQVLLLKQKGVQAILIPGLEITLLNAINSLRQLGFYVPIGTQEPGGFSDNIVKAMGDKIKSISFGFPELSEIFISKIMRFDPDSLKKESKEAIAISYMHLKQMAYAIYNCPNRDIYCQVEYMKKSPPASEMSFRSWKNRIANYDMNLLERVNGGKIILTSND
jgi:branched-chain amino acid transport system substrate-binding protein